MFYISFAGVCYIPDGHVLITSAAKIIYQMTTCENCFVVQSRRWTQFYRANQPTLWTLLGKTQRRIKSVNIFQYKCAVKFQFSYSFIQTKSLIHSSTGEVNCFCQVFVSPFIFSSSTETKGIRLDVYFCYEIDFNQIWVFYLLQLIITRITPRHIKKPSSENGS